MSTDDFTLDLEVPGSGLINATIRQTGQELRFRGTFVGDVLIDLARATVDIGSGEAYRTFQWPNEPDYWRWDFLTEYDRVLVTVAYVTEDYNWKNPEDQRGTVQFEAHVSTRALIAAVLDALDTVLRTFGAAEFDVDWDPSQVGTPTHFPYIDYGRLREMHLRANPA